MLNGLIDLLIKWQKVSRLYNLTESVAETQQHAA